jgi:hypothetical protein
MTAENQMWAKLAEPFPDSEVKQRPGRGSMTFSYVDARAVMQRLDDVLTPAGWEFTSSVLPGTDIVHGRLTVAGFVREDYGYPNSDKDEEPIKAASSDALKRCAVMFGVGRHLYDDNKPQTRSVAPQRPAPARPAPVGQDPYPDAPALNEWGNVPEEPEDLFAPIGGAIPAVVPTDTCPLHGTKWGGSPGDLFHGPKGVVPTGYCRHPDNIKRSARAS